MYSYVYLLTPISIERVGHSTRRGGGDFSIIGSSVSIEFDVQNEILGYIDNFRVGPVCHSLITYLVPMDFSFYVKSFCHMLIQFVKVVKLGVC